MSRAARGRLGKGLGALLGDYLDEDAPDAASDARTVPVAAISANRFQPRREFAPEELEELTASIRENGLLQPLVVRRDPSDPERFELVAGERRWRAVTELGWRDVSAILRDVDDETLLVLALVENLQREALNPLEEAEGYRALTERFGLTQQDVARAVGKRRSTVANLMRLLKLPPSVRKLLREDRLSMGHARALLAVDNPVKLAEMARKAVREGWSVREVERRVSKPASGTPASSTRQREARDPVLRALEQALEDRLSARVRVRGAADAKGAIEIPFDGAEEFERLFAIIAGREASEVVG